MCEQAFDETKQYGMYAEIVLSGYPVHGPSAYYHIIGFEKWCEEAVDLAKRWLNKHINDFIPKEKRDQVEWIIKPPVEGPDLYIQNGTVGWKYTPNLGQSKLGEITKRSTECLKQPKDQEITSPDQI